MGSGPAVARAEELIDEACESPARAIHDAELVILAAPPLAALDLIDELAGPLAAHLAPGALVTDVVEHEGRHRRPGGSGGTAVRRRPPDGRPRGRRVRRGPGGAVQRPAVGRRPGVDVPGTAIGNVSRPSRKPAAGCPWR